MLRDQSGLIHTATIPAGNSHWQARPSSNPSRYIFRDGTGASGGITRVVLRAANPNGFGHFFRADVRIKGADLTGASNATTGTATLRIGNDCWEEAGPCRVSGGGRTARCETAVPSLSCPAS